jgi:hypothetical protein
MPGNGAELGRERVHCASTINGSPAFPILTAGGEAEFELGFERTRQTYASRAPSADEGPDPPLKRTTYAKNSRRRRQPIPKNRARLFTT